MSVEVNPKGAIKSVHIHTPHNQINEISCDERSLTILTIKGILKKGRMIAAARPIIFTNLSSYARAKNLTNTFMRSSISRIVRDAVRAMPKPCTLKEATVVAYSKARRKVLSSSLLARLK